MVWPDDTEKMTLSAHLSKLKCHSGHTESFVPKSLFLYGKKLSVSYADYQDNMNGDVFGDFIEELTTRQKGFGSDG